MNRTNNDIIRQLSQVGLKPPRVATLAVTNWCNLRCRHCWPDSGPGEQTPVVPKNLVLRLIAGFSAMGAKKFVITGGEPLTHPDWFDILTFATSQPGVTEVRLQTNATQLTPQKADELASLKDRGLIIQTSLEGAAPEAHDYVRGQDSFLQTLQGLKRLQERGMARHICITFTEMRHNFEDIPKLLEMVEGMGIVQFITGTLVCGGRAVESGDLTPPTPRQYEELLERYSQDKAFRDRYHRIGNIAALEWCQADTKRSETCCAFIETPYVSAQGHLYPCVMLHADEFAATNIYSRSLKTSIAEKIDSWSQLQQRKQSRLTNLSNCISCRYYTRCGAGCMGRAFTAYKDFLAVEDRCRLRKAVYKWTET